MLILTLGDPYSINIEMVAMQLAKAAAGNFPCLILGSYWHWCDQLQELNLQHLLSRVKKIDGLSQVATLNRGTWSFFDCGGSPKRASTLTAKERGAAAWAPLAILKTLPLPGFAHPLTPLNRQAVITGAIDKHACALAGFAFSGQTEFFADLWQKPTIMTLAGPQLRVGLVTNHLPLSMVATQLSVDLVAAKLALFAQTLRVSFGLVKPRIAVCGLNPHAGDGGLFGDEEATIIQPGIQQMLARNALPIAVSGPLPADTVFYRAYRGDYDGVLAMYHDQGLGPLKTVHFDQAINLSGGLPHLRVSPDHGPAADLFLQQRASSASWQACFQMAARYLHEPVEGRA